MADDSRDLDLSELLKNFRPSEESGPEKREAAPVRHDNPYPATPETENTQPRALREKEVKVLGVWGTQDPANPDGPPKQTFVLLRDNRGRRAQIFIGPFETMAIVRAIEGTPAERPLTHDLLQTVIERLGAKVDRITIDDLWHGTFYARVTLALKSGEMVDIDARSSDAIAMAVRARCPIYMAEDVLEAQEPEGDDDE